VSDEIEAFLRREEFQRDRDELDHLVEGPRAGGAQKGFQLRKRLLDGIEIRTVGRKKSEVRADSLNGGLHVGLLVHRQVIEDHDVAGPKRRDQHLLDIRKKRRIVEGAIEDRRGVQAINAERGDDRVRLPMSTGRVISQPETAETTAIATQQVRRDPRFIDEDVAASIMQRLRVLPVAPRGGDIRAPLFVRVYRFF
jgi:hypothetical protein